MPRSSGFRPVRSRRPASGLAEESVIASARPTLRPFDPVLVGRRECDAWAAYYRRDWARFLVAAIGMIRAGFGMPWRRTLSAAWFVLRANQLWAPVPDNDPEGAREQMRRFYALITADQDLSLDPAHAATLEVEWWRVHRQLQRSPAGTASEEQLVTALADLYSYVYGRDRTAVERAARHRARAMQLSDAWVAAGCDLFDPDLSAERLALVASYSALLDAVDS